MLRNEAASGASSERRATWAAAPPNATRYAAPNVSFLDFAVIIDGVAGTAPVKPTFKSISCNGTPESLVLDGSTLRLQIERSNL